MRELKYSFKIRTRRFLLIVIGLLVCFILLGAYLYVQDTKRILNYYFYPLLIYLSFHLFYSKICSNTYNKDDLKSLLYIKKISLADRISILKSVVCIIAWSIFSTLFFTLFLAVFINTTIDGAETRDFSAEIIYCLTNMFWFSPWPVILAYVWLYSLFVHKHAINNMQLIVNKLYPSAVQNNTINNVIIIIHSVSFIVGSCLMTALASYISYVYLCRFMAVVPLQGPSIGCILICLILVLGIVQKKVKTFLRAINYASWSISRCLFAYALMYLFVLTSMTIVINNFIPSNYLAQILVAKYTFYRADLSNFFIDGSIIIWWFCAAVMALKYFRLLPNISSVSEYPTMLIWVYLLSTFVAIIVSCIVLFLLAHSIANLYNIILKFNLENKFLIIILLCIGFTSCLFGKHKDKNLLIVSYLKRTKENKIRAASKSYYLLFIITGTFLTFLLLENILYIYFLLALGTVMNVLLLMVMLRGYNINLNKFSK